MSDEEKIRHWDRCVWRSRSENYTFVTVCGILARNGLLIRIFFSDFLSRPSRVASAAGEVTGVRTPSGTATVTRQKSWRKYQSPPHKKSCYHEMSGVVPRTSPSRNKAANLKGQDNRGKGCVNWPWEGKPRWGGIEGLASESSFCGGSQREVYWTGRICW